MRYKFGVAHGDLHANNVLVRGNDAVILDFPFCQTGPVLLDMATLDVSIAFLCFTEGQDPFDEWAEFMEGIFKLDRLSNTPERSEPHYTHSAQWSAIRQLRRIAASEWVRPEEYVICVAYELLRKCAYINGETDKEKSVSVKMVAVTYDIAHKLVDALIGSQAARKHAA